MSLIAMKDVEFSFGGPALLEDINFQISAMERVCLLGRNGCGKSTFLNLLEGRFKADCGEITREPQLRVAMFNQSVPENVSGKVYDVVAYGLGKAGELIVEYHKVYNQLERNEKTDAAEERLKQLHHELEKVDAWKKLNVIEKVISQVNIDSEAEFSELSAGLKRRVLLARALAKEPDLLILDEPTNHLDVDSIVWLEEFLLRFGKAILFVTHDRKFIRKLSTRIIEIDRGQLFNWDCGYDKYLERKQESLDAEQSQWERFGKKLAQEEVWIRKGIQGRRTRDEGRVRALEKMRELNKQRRNVDGQIKIEVNESQRSGNLVVETKGVEFAYDTGEDESSSAIIHDFTTTIIRGDRVGIIGSNGTGKTTLLRVLLGELAITKGKIRIGTNVQCAYFDQLHGQLDGSKTVYENIGQGYDTVTVNGRSRQVVGYLSDFMFTPEKTRALVSSLSGGERNRLQIAKVFTQPSNVLVLDEPTNDLDVETLELLEEMLMEYKGTVLLVSHDRAFLNNVVTSMFVLEGDGVVREYAGGYDSWLRQRQALEAAKEKPVEKTKKVRSAKTKSTKLNNKQRRELEELPGTIEKLEKQIAALHQKMAEPAFYKQDAEIISEARANLEKFEAGLESAYARWEQLEAIEQN